MGKARVESDSPSSTLGLDVVSSPAFGDGCGTRVAFATMHRQSYHYWLLTRPARGPDE